MQPFVTVDYVHAFDDRAQIFDAEFIGGNGTTEPFALTVWDKDWGEVRADLLIKADGLDPSIAGDSSVARSDIGTGRIRGSMRLRF